LKTIMSSSVSRRIAVALAAAILAAGSLFPAVAGDRAQQDHIIEIRDFRFVPDRLYVRLGDTIRWINRDLAPHTATATDESWDTLLLRQGESGVIKVTQDLADSYFCRFHPQMRAEITIVPPD
jgi:plastocyanin